MSSARHFFARGTLSDEQLKTDITADVRAARQAERDMKAAGQYGAASRMSGAADEALDELNDLTSGTWKPRHA